MNIAIMGFGVVGSGVAELMTKNHAGITEKSMQPSMEIKYILDLRDFPDSPFCDKIIHDFSTILEDDSIAVVVETMGGLHPAYEFVSDLLRAGKSVVTSNKELVAAKGYELLTLAQEKNVNFLFEASVGGGIPIIRPITQCLAANEIDEIAGILNGTTNFILTKMITENMEMGEALAMAQHLGYAEKDPTADVDGIDACRKICILASLCFGKHIYPDQVRTEGIRDVQLRDVSYAANGGYGMKLLGVARRVEGDKLCIFVAPCLVQGHSQLASVDDVFNAILVRGDAIGDVVFYGRGAGKLPTASAVVADVIDCAKHIAKRKLLDWGAPEDGFVIDCAEVPYPFFVRGVCDCEKTAETVRGALAKQELHIENAPEGEIAFLTGEISENALRAALAEIPGFSTGSMMRVTAY